MKGFPQPLQRLLLVHCGGCLLSLTLLLTLRKRPKSLLLQTETGPLTVMLRQRCKRLKAGGKIDLYLTDSTPVDERDGQQTVYAYLAIENSASLAG